MASSESSHRQSPATGNRSHQATPSNNGGAPQPLEQRYWKPYLLLQLSFYLACAIAPLTLWLDSWRSPVYIWEGMLCMWGAAKIFPMIFTEAHPASVPYRNDAFMLRTVPIAFLCLHLESMSPLWAILLFFEPTSQIVYSAFFGKVNLTDAIVAVATFYLMSALLLWHYSRLACLLFMIYGPIFIIERLNVLEYAINTGTDNFELVVAQQRITVLLFINIFKGVKWFIKATLEVFTASLSNPIL